MQDTTTNEATPAKSPDRPMPLALQVKEKLLGAAEDLRLVAPDGTDAMRLLHVIAGVIVRNPKLVNCSIASLMSCAKDCMALGLEPNTHHGHCYLIPRWNREANGSVATLQIGYKGFAYLLWRSGQVRMLGAGLVHEAELGEFRIVLGTRGEVRHVPAIRDRGEPVGVYAYVDLVEGGTAVDWMPIDEVRGIMRRSEAWQMVEGGKAKSSPWHVDFGEMAKKTVVKRIQKLLQIGGLVATAVEVDDRDYRTEDVAPKRKPRASFGDPAPANQSLPEESEVAIEAASEEIPAEAAKPRPEPVPVAQEKPQPKPARARVEDEAWELGA